MKRKTTATLATLALAGGAGIGLTGCDGSADGSASGTVTAEDMKKWSADFEAHPTVKKLNTDGTAHPGDSPRLLADVKAVRDKAPDVPYANAEFDKMLAKAEAALRADVMGHPNQTETELTGMRTAARAFVDKVEAKFPSFLNDVNDPWVQGQLDEAEKR